MIAIESIYHARSRIAPFLIPSPQPSPGGRGRKEFVTLASIETALGQVKVACSQERIGSLPRETGRVENTRYGSGSGIYPYAHIALRPPDSLQNYGARKT